MSPCSTTDVMLACSITDVMLAGLSDAFCFVQEELAAQLAVVEKLSAEAGTNKVFQSINNGSFRTRTVAVSMDEQSRVAVCCCVRHSW